MMFVLLYYTDYCQSGQLIQMHFEVPWDYLELLVFILFIRIKHYERTVVVLVARRNLIIKGNAYLFFGFE